MKAAIAALVLTLGVSSVFAVDTNTSKPGTTKAQEVNTTETNSTKK